MIRVTPFPSYLEDYSGKNSCDVCGKKINLDLPFSRGMKVYCILYYINKLRPYERTLFAHQGACETMAVLQVSNEISSPASK